MFFSFFSLDDQQLEGAKDGVGNLQQSFQQFKWNIQRTLFNVREIHTILQL